MTMVMSKPVVRAYEPGSRHMVGDGFDVRNMFPSNNLGQQQLWTICDEHTSGDPASDGRLSGGKDGSSELG
jgi:hypothetical protein